MNIFTLYNQGQKNVASESLYGDGNVRTIGKWFEYYYSKPFHKSE